MNQSSLSISDAGKSGSLLRPGAGEAKVSADSEESGSFLSTLGAIFQSESEVGDKAVTAQEVDAETSDDGAVKLSEVDAEGESIDKLTQGEETGNAKGEVAPGDESGDDSDSDTVKTDSQKTTLPPDKLAQTMDEGNQLLDRLDESRQVLNEPRGNSLPPEGEQLADDAVNAADKTDVSKTVSMPESRPEAKMLTEGEEVVFKNGEAVAVDGELVAAETTGKTSENEQSKLLSEKQLSEYQRAQTGVGDESVSGLKTSQLTKELSSEEGKSPLPDDSELVWQDAAKGASLAAGVTAAASVHGRNALREAPESVAKIPLTGMNIPAGEELTESSIDADETNLSTQINWGSPLPEHGKAAIDSSKLATSQTALAQQIASQGQAQQNQAALLAQAQAQAVSADKFASQQVMTNAELNAAQIQNAGINTLDVATNSSSPTLKAAVAAGASAGVLAATKGALKNSNDNRESGLSQQLAGLASSQGAQQAQIKADMQQAVAQSPLQLSREAAGEKVSEQVQMMMSKNLKNIDIRLDPPELGRMQIRMSMNNDVASVHFTVSNPQAREMVEQAMPRLREMMAQQGLQLSDSSVQQQNSGSQQRQYAAGNEAGSSGGNGGSLAGEEGNLDESINLDVNIAAKDDGISYYA